MMIHEIHNPINPSNTRIRMLPNGKQVDFGKGKKSGSLRAGSSSPVADQAVSSSSSSPSFDGVTSNLSEKNTPEALLPNGEKPNFFNDKKDKGNTKAKSPKNKKKDQKQKKKGEATLPNGEKPNFGGEKKNTGKSPSSQGMQSSNSVSSVQSLPNGDRPNFYGDKNYGDKAPSSSTTSLSTNKKNKTPAIVEENYAGSSFHSSPAALNLPKPSFKSPKQVNVDEASVTSPSSRSSTPIVQPSHIGIVENQPHPPPQYPVTMYQPALGAAQLGNPLAYNSHGQYIQQPGFTYQYNPQGYVQYQYPHQSPPNAQHIPFQRIPQGMGPTGVPGVPQSAPAPLQQRVQLPLPPHHPHHVHPMYAVAPANEHKITFNDLLGSVQKRD